MPATKPETVRKRMLKRLHFHWEWGVCFFTLLILALFLLGHDLYGLRSSLAFLLGLVGTVVLAILGFFFASLIAPLVALITSALTSLFALVVVPVLTFLMTTIIVPLTAFATGLVSSLLAWLATTWLGTLLAPVINLVAPLVIKFGPWVAATRNANWVMKTLAPWWKKMRGKLVYRRRVLNEETSTPTKRTRQRKARRS